MKGLYSKQSGLGRKKANLLAGREQIFHDRSEAGRELAAALLPWKDQHPIILALPRGGVPIGFEVAKALSAPLDILIVRKIGMPGFPEVGLGAIVEGNPPHMVLNETMSKHVNVSEDYLDAEIAHQRKEIERRRKVYRGRPSCISLKDRTVIVVDDGIATGGTVKAALKALALEGAKQRILAVPVAPQDVLQSLANEVDEIICLRVPEPFYSVGMHYEDFSQLTDRDVTDLLKKSVAK